MTTTRPVVEVKLSLERIDNRSVSATPDVLRRRDGFLVGFCQQAVGDDCLSVEVKE